MRTIKTIHPTIVRLRQLRKSQNIQQQELAIRIGVSKTQVCCWERGFRVPNFFNLVCWAEALGVEIKVMEK
jgi:transcriptional regulator with XRE-family HTH domain